jgi:hypothetical protein
VTLITHFPKCRHVTKCSREITSPYFTLHAYILWLHVAEYFGIRFHSSSVANNVGPLVDPTAVTLLEVSPQVAVPLGLQFPIILRNVTRHSVYTLHPVCALFLYFVQNLGVMFSFPLILSDITYRAVLAVYTAYQYELRLFNADTWLRFFFCFNL